MATTNDKNNIESPKNVKTRPFVGSSLLQIILKSLIIRVFAVILIYAFGYWNMNPVWLFFAWGFVKYWNRKKLEHRFKTEVFKAVNERDDRKLILSNVYNFPSWVYFTDTERCEWLNKAIKHVWPTATVRLNKLVLQQLKKLEPYFTKQMIKYKKNIKFQFDSLRLGSMAPRISGIRVYGESGNVARRIMDINVYWMSDCEFKSSLKSTINFGGNNFQLRGRLRLFISTPGSTSSPGMEIFFVQSPEVDFQLSGVQNMLHYSHIGDVLHETVNKVIMEKFVQPNACTVNYGDKIILDELKIPDLEGLLEINIIEAKELEGPKGMVKPLLYSSTDLPDPYASVTFESKRFVTPVVKSSMDPVWNFSAVFIVDCFFDDSIKIEVEDQKYKRNLGELTVFLKRIEKNASFKTWIQLEGVVAGMVHVGVTYHKIECNPNPIVPSGLPAILEVFIDDAEDFANSKGDIIAEVSVGGVTKSSRSVTTVTIDCPIFREALSLPVKNPKTDKVLINLTNNKGKKSFRKAETDIEQLLKAKNMVVINNQTKVKGANETSRFNMSMRLRTFKSE